ncbi:MAG: DNA sulfur modification protein DndD [Gammaproteobacteria bacterium]|nr:DNA sulfur modification protein DndD [Gammaproteobacteria bacterium]
MQLESIIISDFGLFRGEHEIDLSPRTKYNSTRPIILFGGLNGAGKTTILTAIRLAIYGKQALGYSVSQRAYDEYLASKVHRNPNALVASNKSHVGLEFIFYKLGKPTRYKVVRSWTVSGKSVRELLTIHQDDEAIPEFSQDQCQAFLNELIPMGVSELFFFDGEKIKDLAEDGGDIALRDAIRKLLGLDIIERLKSDLHIYVRRQNSKTFSDDSRIQIEQYEKEYAQLKVDIKLEEGKAQEQLPNLTSAKEQLGRLEENLASKGGAWAISRQTLKQNREKLLADKKIIESQVREHLNGLYPLSLAPTLMNQLNEQLKSERVLMEWSSIADAVNQRLALVNDVISEYIPGKSSQAALKKVKEVFADLVTRPKEIKNKEVVHDLSGKDNLQLEDWISEALNQVPVRTLDLRKKLQFLEDELSTVSLQIARAPDQESLQSDLDAIKAKSGEISKLITERNTHLELARRLTWQAIELVRKMRKFEAMRTSGETQGTGNELAKQTIDVLSDFASEMTNRKVVKLEEEFAKTFARLARKSDATVRAQIDPSSFEVHLFNKNGKGIPKKDLSAGEKQIYAVAMLEALAKTSGRKLPIIIDTPLGRLDSHHREKLINNYFPLASHQVIILSTDTEVDKNFYEDLNKHVSHCYHIKYDETEGASEITEGYFWKSLPVNQESPSHAT